MEKKNYLQTFLPILPLEKLISDVGMNGGIGNFSSKLIFVQIGNPFFGINSLSTATDFINSWT